MKVDFYVLKEGSALKSLQFTCTLIEKAYQEGKQVYVHTSSLADAERIDNLLWTFRDDSFIPHSIYQTNATEVPPICIGYGEQPPQNDILINLSEKVPTFFQQFNTLIEIVFNDPVVQQLARERYKHYRDHQCEINTIKN